MLLIIIKGKLQQSSHDLTSIVPDISLIKEVRNTQIK